METIRFFNTTTPYSELNYLLGSKTEQVIEVMHTHNIKPNWNASFNTAPLILRGFLRIKKQMIIITSFRHGMKPTQNGTIISLSFLPIICSLRKMEGFKQTRIICTILNLLKTVLTSQQISAEMNPIAQIFSHQKYSQEPAIASSLH